MQQGATRGAAAERVRLRVLYDFEYETRGKRVRIIKDERLLLLHRTNGDWWQVVRPADLVGSSNFFVPEQITFYVPTGYVVEAQEEPLPESTRFYVDKDRMFSKSSSVPNEHGSHGTGSSTASSSSSSSSSSNSNNNSGSTLQDETNNKPSARKEEPSSSSSSSRKAHDSFRSVMKKLSGNLTGSSHGSDGGKSSSNKAPKIVKSQRKKSVDNNCSGEEAVGSKSILGALVPAKHKDVSAFGMCFGRDVKNAAAAAAAADAQLLNPFQEELANKVIQKKSIVLESKVDAVGVNNNNNDKNDNNNSNKHEDKEEEQSSSFENIYSKWEKVSGHVFKNNNRPCPEIVPKRPPIGAGDSGFQFVSLAKIKEDAQKRRSASPNFQGSTNNNNNNGSAAAAAAEAKPASGGGGVVVVVDKGPKKLSRSLPEQKSTVASLPVPAGTSEPEKKPRTDSIGDNDKPVAEKPERAQESPSKDKDRLLINDKRKMWAIETLMSELMQSSASSSGSKVADKSEGDEDDGKGSSRPCQQLAQELHDMNSSRRFENAEIQVNLLEHDPELDDDDDKDKDKQQQQGTKDSKDEHRQQLANAVAYRRNKVFHFPPPPPRSSMVKAPRSPTARSPKLLDEYNEANILNDNERTFREQQQQQQQQQQHHHQRHLHHRHQQTDEEEEEEEEQKKEETPSYSNISLRVRRDRVPCALKMPSKDFREKIQLTPSLERLASEIKFLPANAADAERQSVLDLDCPTTTLSQDSLRLYKRRSKSDGALNKRDPRRRDCSVDRTPRRNLSSASHMEIFEAPRGPRLTREPLVVERKYARCSLVVRQEPVQHQEHCRAERSRYSKLERKSRSLGDLDCSTDEKKEEEADEAEGRRRYKPVPKLRSKESLRRIKQSAPDLTPAASAERLIGRPIPAKRRIQPQHQPMCDSSLDELSEIDIERSTAIGFKTLLRTSDSGSEEYLQYKTFPASSRAQLPQQQQQQQHSTPKPQNTSLSDGNVNLSRSLSDEMMILSSTSCSSASPSRARDSSLENLIELPPGWTQSYDHAAKRVCFVNERGDKWFSSNDEEGKIYFFEENSNESSWALPLVNTDSRVRTISNGDWPQLFDGNMCILKEGTISKTKITTENGKKLRKAWSTSYAVLTELFLLFFKDAKTYAAMKMDPLAAAKPDISIDLNGAFIEPGEKLSNRKNVYLINTLLGLQVLVQSDNALVIAEWYREIHDAIQRLPFSQEYGRTSSSRE